jgi:hypothetical protein
VAYRCGFERGREMRPRNPEPASRTHEALSL